MNIVHINSNDELVEMVSRLAGKDYLAVDTEFIRIDTFYPRFALLQIGDGETQYLVDPLKITNFSPLFPLFLSEYPRKLLHACSEDIEVLTRLIGAKPKGIVDTQIAAAFLGQGLQTGYQKALLENLGIDIPKGESRSDWLHRPLSDAQISYAALDVKYLIPLYENLQEKLSRQGFSDWFQRDCHLMLNQTGETTDAGLLYQDISSAWRLNRRSLAVLRELTMWREQEAVKRDMPRGFLIKNSSLMPLAHKQPDNLQALSGIEDISPRILRREGNTILEIIERARNLPEDQLPLPVPTPLPREAKNLFDDLKKAAKPVSEKTGVPEEVLLRKRHIESLVINRVDQGENADLPLALKDWRGELLLPVLEPVLHTAKETLKAWQQERRRAVESVK